MRKIRIRRVAATIAVCITLLIVTVCVNACTTKHGDEQTTKTKPDTDAVIGTIYDTNGIAICESETVAGKQMSSYQASYSHLLGNIGLENFEGLINRYSRTLTDKSAPDRNPQKGYSLTLTIDDKLNQFADSLTNRTFGSTVILRRHSGELAALTSTSWYYFNLGRPLNTIATERYEDDSLDVLQPEYLHAYTADGFQKIITAAIGCEAGLTDYTFSDCGFIDYGGLRIENLNGEIHGSDLDMTKALCMNSNTYFASLMNSIDQNTVHRVISDLKLDATVETDFGMLENSTEFGVREGEGAEFSRALLGVGASSKYSPAAMASIIQALVDNEMYQLRTIKNTCYSGKDGYLKIAGEAKDQLNDSGILADSTCTKVKEIMKASADAYGLGDSVTGAVCGTNEVIREGQPEYRSYAAAYNDAYIVVMNVVDEYSETDLTEAIQALFEKLGDNTPAA